MAIAETGVGLGPFREDALVPSTKGFQNRPLRHAEDFDGSRTETGRRGLC